MAKKKAKKNIVRRRRGPSPLIAKAKASAKVRELRAAYAKPAAKVGRVAAAAVGGAAIDQAVERLSPETWDGPTKSYVKLGASALLAVGSAYIPGGPMGQSMIEAAALGAVGVAAAEITDDFLAPEAPQEV